LRDGDVARGDDALFAVDDSDMFTDQRRNAQITM
jgi:hypothetical protein